MVIALIKAMAPTLTFMEVTGLHPPKYLKPKRIMLAVMIAAPGESV